jgi:hypothetical protein
VIDVKPGERRTVKLEPGARSRFLEPQSQAEEPQEPRRKVAVAQTRKQSEEQAVRLDFNPRQIHKKWWFWTGVGAVTVLTVGLAAGLSSRGGSANPPVTGEVIAEAPTWGGGTIDARVGGLALVGGLL